MVVVRFTEQEASVPSMIAKVNEALGNNETLILTDHNGAEILDWKRCAIWATLFTLSVFLKIYFDSGKNVNVASQLGIKYIVGFELLHWHLWSQTAAINSVKLLQPFQIKLN